MSKLLCGQFRDWPAYFLQSLAVRCSNSGPALAWPSYGTDDNAFMGTSNAIVVKIKLQIWSDELMPGKAWQGLAKPGRACKRLLGCCNVSSFWHEMWFLMLLI